MTMDIDLQYSRSVQWSPSGHRLAILKQGDASSGVAILNDPDPASGEPTDVGTSGISAFTWASDSTAVIAAHGSDFGPALFRIDANSGTEEMLAKLPELPNFLYPSPDHSMVAFTGNSNDGWHLYLFDTRQTGVLRDLGAMGSDGPDGQPVPQGAPDVKTPMYVAWSPDGSQLAFGGGMDPPYVMHIIDIASGAVRVTEFADGYPGEIKWSPDGALLAVSTYNIPRTHHESYVVDPATGLARDVLSGCVIVWSPDSRFLAIHGEVVPGVAIADVHTLAHAQLTHTIGDTPLRWDP
jgi:Tol biopolymer transport system component